MTATDCINLINEKVKSLQRERIKQQVAINCLGEEISRLEDLAFEIEKIIERTAEKSE